MFLFTSITVLSSGTSCICSVDLEGIDSMKCFASWHFDCSSLYILQSSKAEQNFVVNCISYGKIRSGQQEWQMIRDRPNIILYRWVHLWFTYVPFSSLIHLYSLYFWLCFFFFLTPILSLFLCSQRPPLLSFLQSLTFPPFLSCSPSGSQPLRVSLHPSGVSQSCCQISSSAARLPSHPSTCSITNALSLSLPLSSLHPFIISLSLNFCGSFSDPLSLDIRVSDYFAPLSCLAPLLWLMLNIDEKIKPFHISSRVSVPSTFKCEDGRMTVNNFLPSSSVFWSDSLMVTGSAARASTAL